MPTGPGGAVGRRRRTPPATVTVVLATGDQVTMAHDAPLARAMGALAALLAHWDDRHAYSVCAPLPKDLRGPTGRGRT